MELPEELVDAADRVNIIEIFKYMDILDEITNIQAIKRRIKAQCITAEKELEAATEEDQDTVALSENALKDKAEILTTEVEQLKSSLLISNVLQDTFQKAAINGQIQEAVVNSLSEEDGDTVVNLRDKVKHREGTVEILIFLLQNLITGSGTLWGSNCDLVEVLLLCDKFLSGEHYEDVAEQGTVQSRHKQNVSSPKITKYFTSTPRSKRKDRPE